MDNLKHRIISSICWIIPLVVIVYFSTHSIVAIFFAIAVSVILSIALWEYYKMAQAKQFHPVASLMIIGSICFILASFIAQIDSFWSFSPLFIAAILFLALFLYSFAKHKEPFANVAISYFGFIYIIIPLTLIIHINFFSSGYTNYDGRFWLLYLFLVTKSADMGGYFLGKSFGRYKLAASISPGKTVEGFFGGIAFSIIASVILWFIDRSLNSFLGITWFEAIWLAILIGILGQLGDLSESLLKRDVGVKDSNSFPGFGGILDMVDSLIFTTPVVYTFIRLGLV